METKEIKKEIRQLSKLKRACRVGTDERRDLNKKIRVLKEQLEAQTNNIDQETRDLIEQIQKLDPLTLRIELDLTKYSKEELRKHIENLKRRKQ